ncbi:MULTISPECIES: hypothetical protein [unclassified Mycobacterium]|uniref:hypothetical protein n=1 Tax=unclassified Mycobacterium TaxID=2642494 RepID=UPI00073FC099|nr:MULTISPECIES: hypothetical protein [unclassified Mycobacterium]KUH85315.1 hypothetical protein AU185_02370 [Mycobacterium sp. GA-0227b]KUH87095.1 hypothetical protein AU186_00100 [Mycobacterium sp. GA-1999]
MQEPDNKTITLWAVGIIVMCCAAAVGMVFGWRVFTGWWTPGWGNLFTVAVATAALAVGAWFNRRTLSSAAERHDQGRLDGRYDKLRSEVAALLSASGQRRSQMEVFAKQVNDLIAGTPSVADRGTLMVAIQAALNESVGALYAKINGHAYAVRMLTNDSQIVDRIGEIEEVLKADLADYAVALEIAPKPRDPITLRRIQERRDAQTKALAGATDQLLAYCSGKFSALD